MKEQVKMSSLRIYLGVGVSGMKSPKVGFEFKNISGSEKIDKSVHFYRGQRLNRWAVRKIPPPLEFCILIQEI